MAFNTYPFGSLEITQEWKNTYGHIPYYAIPNNSERDSYPKKHPLLQRLEGAYQLKAAIPTSWHSAVRYTLPDSNPLFYQLTHLTLEEYMDGKIQEDVWKSFRNSMRPDDRRQYPQSPKIGTILDSLPEHSRISRVFNDRGAYSGQRLIITSLPECFIYMSNGNGWTSCQHYSQSGYSRSIEGNIIDPYVGLAMVVNDKAMINGKDTIEARAVIRIMHTYEDMDPLLIVDNIYKNNDFAASSLRVSLAALLHSEAIPSAFVHNPSDISLLLDDTTDMTTVLSYPVNYTTARDKCYQDVFSEVRNLPSGTTVFTGGSYGLRTEDSLFTGMHVPTKIEGAVYMQVEPDTTYINGYEHDDDDHDNDDDDDHDNDDDN